MSVKSQTLSPLTRLLFQLVLKLGFTARSSTVFSKAGRSPFMRRPIQVPPKFQVPRVVVRAISDLLVDYGVPGTPRVDTDAIPFRELHA